MKLQKVLPLLFAAIALVYVSCGSAPKEEPVAEPQVVEVVPEPAPEPQPEPQVVPEPEPVVEQDFSEANEALLKGTENAKIEAVAANAEKYCGDKFSVLDEELNQLKKDMSENPKADYSDRIKNLTSRYKALEKAAKAKALKEKIDELDLSAYDKKSYDDGVGSLDAFDSYGKDVDGKVMLETATSAFNSFTNVFTKAFKSLAGSERKAALEAKKLADSVKAGVSQKDAYKNASDKFKKADSDFVTMNIEGAYKGYSESKLEFTALYEKVSEARKAAAEAIERAKLRAQQSEDYASDADTISPLGDGEVKGIESEDAKLLEDDNFEDAKNSEIDVESDATAKAAEVATEALLGTVESLEKAEPAVTDKAEEVKTEATEAAEKTEEVISGKTQEIEEKAAEVIEKAEELKAELNTEEAK